MPASNPYELSKRATKNAPRRDPKTVTFTKEEQIKKLEGYLCISKKNWAAIGYDTHVRYIETAKRGGEFRSGGFVIKNPFDTKTKTSTTPKRFIKLQSTPPHFGKTAFGRREWIVAYEDIEYLYAKTDAATLSVRFDLQTAVTTLNGNIERIKVYAQRLEKRLAKAEQRLAKAEQR